MSLAKIDHNKFTTDREYWSSPLCTKGKKGYYRQAINAYVQVLLKEKTILKTPTQKSKYYNKLILTHLCKRQQKVKFPHR